MRLAVIGHRAVDLVRQDRDLRVAREALDERVDLAPSG